MSKIKTIFACQHCGAQYRQWQGQCTECGKWNTIFEDEPLPTKKTSSQFAKFATDNRVHALTDIALDEKTRLSTGLKEFDHVLGGGLVTDSAVLIGGDPGVGKSTLLIQTLNHVAQQASVLYVTGEESLAQVAMRAQRLGLSNANVKLYAETHIENILKIASKEMPGVMVIDSIQTMFSDEVESAAGSVSQVRQSAAKLVSYAKQMKTALLIAGHVTKEGALAGPRVLEHMVDTVLYFEGQRDQRFRIVRAVKNRFGAVNELGLFAMTERGLKEINNPSAMFLSRSSVPVAGSSVMVTWEGSRPLLVEVQALVSESHLGNPRRITVGLEQNRLAMLLAVLNRHAGIITHDQDVFLNVVGGIRINETASDVAALLAIISSLKNKPLPQDLIAFGEVGLSGEIRPVTYGQERLKEAAKHGFKTALVPEANISKQNVQALVLKPLKNVMDLLNLF